jgi:hypothetical protein
MIRPHIIHSLHVIYDLMTASLKVLLSLSINFERFSIVMSVKKI